MCKVRVVQSAGEPLAMPVNGSGHGAILKRPLLLPMRTIKSVKRQERLPPGNKPGANNSSPATRGRKVRDNEDYGSVIGGVLSPPQSRTDLEYPWQAS